MADNNDLKIGFIKPGAGRSHYDHFSAMIPDGIDLDMQDLGVMQSALTPTSRGAPMPSSSAWRR